MTLNGTYLVTFKRPDGYIDEQRFYKFEGKCDNFVPSGKCAFSNDNNEMLIVYYDDIVQMRLVKEDI